MNKKVLKFTLMISEMSSIEMPKEAQVLSVITQNNQAMIYALCDIESSNETRHFEVHGTGHNIGYDMGVSRKFIGTVQLNNGAFVGHVFERLN